MKGVPHIEDPGQDDESLPSLRGRRRRCSDVPSDVHNAWFLVTLQGPPPPLQRALTEDQIAALLTGVTCHCKVLVSTTRVDLSVGRPAHTRTERPLYWTHRLKLSLDRLYEPRTGRH